MLGRSPEHRQFRRVVVRQRLQQRRLENGEDRAVRSNAQRQGENRRYREELVPHEQPETEGEILSGRVE